MLSKFKTFLDGVFEAYFKSRVPFSYFELSIIGYYVFATVLDVVCGFWVGIPIDVGFGLMFAFATYFANDARYWRNMFYKSNDEQFKETIKMNNLEFESSINKNILYALNIRVSGYDRETNKVYGVFAGDDVNDTTKYFNPEDYMLVKKPVQEVKVESKSKARRVAVAKAKK